MVLTRKTLSFHHFYHTNHNIILKDNFSVFFTKHMHTLSTNMANYIILKVKINIPKDQHFGIIIVWCFLFIFYVFYFVLFSPSPFLFTSEFDRH